MSDNFSFRLGFNDRLADLAEKDGIVKSAGPLRALGAGAAKLLGKGVAKAPGAAATQRFLDAKLLYRQGQTAKLRGRVNSMMGGAENAPNLSAKAPAAAGAAPGAAPAAAPVSDIPGAAPSPVSGLQDRIGKVVAGMNPGLARRAIAGPQFANATPLNHADLGKTVMNRAGGAALGAGTLGAANVYGQYQGAEEAKRRAAQSSFMQRLAFLMNPNIVNQM